MDALFLPLANALGASVDQIKVLYRGHHCIHNVELTFFDGSLYHVYSLHTPLDHSLCEYHPRSQGCVIYSVSSWPLDSSSPFFGCTLHSFNCWQVFWPRILLPIFIKAKACLGWSLCMLRHLSAGNSF